ncbi:MAG: molybdenum cofactor guanylyltransferase [Deltaproteobacteria bacterium]|nr:molybdenum cofactor guanylyltransferase [Deltaproteobacteria bacterium]
MILAASAIILAGGQSRRMGKPKAALRFGNSTILERLITELRGFDDILIIAAPAQSEPFPIEHLLRAAPSAVRLLRDRTAYQGAAVALALGLAAAKHEIAFTCSCDLPLLRAEVVHALCGMLNGYEAVIPQIAAKPQPLCAVYRRSVATVIEMELASGERRLTRIIAGLRAYRPGDLQLRQIDPELRSFINVNTLEDYNRALVLAL